MYGFLQSSLPHRSEQLFLIALVSWTGYVAHNEESHLWMPFVDQSCRLYETVDSLLPRKTAHCAHCRLVRPQSQLISQHLDFNRGSKPRRI